MEDADQTDLYDRVDKIPFDKITDFFKGSIKVEYDIIYSMVASSNGNTNAMVTAFVVKKRKT
ncbi:MAG: hypothetical protein ACLRPW_11690 [Intestinibacter sp.]